MQHRIQQTLEQSWDLGRTARARSPTAVLEAMLKLKDRIRSISQDMHALNSSCCVELGSSLTQRRKRRSEKRFCSDTIEDTSSSASEADAWKKRARCYKVSSPPIPHTHPDQHSLHLHITSTCSMYSRCSHDERYHERASVHCTFARTRRLIAGASHDPHCSSLGLPSLCDLAHGGYAGERLGEARNPGPATHNRDRPAADQRNTSQSQRGPRTHAFQIRQRRLLLQPQHRRRRPTLGDLSMRGPSSPESIFDVRSVAQILPSEQSPATASCSTWFRNGGRQQLLPESVGQLRHLDRAACEACGIIRWRRCRWCTFCGSDTRDTPFRDLRVGDTFQDRRQPGHQSAAPDGSPTAQQPPQDSLLVPRHATAWAESLEGAISRLQTWALLCRYRCPLLLAEVPKGTDRNSELKLRRRMWETGQVSELTSKIL